MIRFFLQFLLALALPVMAGRSLPDKPALPADTLFPDQLPGPFTGGFGEETCNSCHFDYDINDPRGSLTIEGLAKTFTPGERYPIQVTVESERLRNGGFQMTARFEDGSQAGTFEWTGDRITLTRDDVTDRDIQYLQHTREGTQPTEERMVRWSFEWVAPQNGKGTVLFHIAANAGNDDLSAFGDWIYVEEITSAPSAE